MKILSLAISTRILLHKTISGFLCIISEQISCSSSPGEINRNNRSISVAVLVVLIVIGLFRKTFIF